MTQSSIVNRPRQSPIVNHPWLALVLTLIVCLPPLLIDLGTRESTHTMENVALVTSQETWLRLHEGDARAWLMTSNDGLPRVEKPPMLTWLDFVAWSDLDPRTATPVQLTFRARIVTVVLGLIMLASIFWIGSTLFDARLAVTATLVAGAMQFFQHQSRTASYDIHFVTWATVAIAAGFWAMKAALDPARTRRRRMWGWSLCAVALCFSMMSKNPLPLVLVILPLAATIIIAPPEFGPRKPMWLGLVCATIVALIPVGGWYGYALITVETAAHTLRNETTQPRKNPQVWYYYIATFGLVLPWTIWLIAGLIQPFAKEWKSRKRTLLIPWLWFVITIVFFSLWPAKQQRYILPIVPAAALLVAHAWRIRPDVDDRPATDVVNKALRESHWAMLTFASLMFGPFCVMQDWLVAHKYLDQRAVMPLTWPAGIVLSIALLAVALYGWRVNWRNQWMHAANVTAIWTIMVMAVFWHVWSATPATKQHGYRLEAERMAALIGDAPVRTLRIGVLDIEKYKLNEEFRFYFGRLIPRIMPDGLKAYAESSSAASPVYVLCKDQNIYRDALSDSGFVRKDVFHSDQDDDQELWEFRR